MAASTPQWSRVDKVKKSMSFLTNAEKLAISREHQTSNLGVGGSNPSERAN
jgi:hypothetical protein